MPRQWTWHHPKSLEEAARILEDHGGEAMVVAGGTAVCLSPPRREELAMIDLGRAGASTIEREEGGLRLGAMVTPETLARSQALDAVGMGMLREAGRAVGPRPVRNRATVGGSVVRAYPWADLPAPLLALDARFELIHARREPRTLSAGELFASQPRVAIEPGEILACVLLRADEPGEGGAYVRFSATKVEHALASVAVRLRVDGESCVEVRVAAGALSPLPQRLRDVEDALRDGSLDDSAIDRASEGARSVQVARDRRADEAYRRELAVVLARRALRTARDRAKGGTP